MPSYWCWRTVGDRWPFGLLVRAEGWVLRLPERIRWRIAFMLPRSIALLAFVRVYGATGYIGDDYEHVYRAWEAGKGR